jgi:hypothetical protein
VTDYFAMQSRLNKNPLPSALHCGYLSQTQSVFIRDGMLVNENIKMKHNNFDEEYLLSNILLIHHLFIKISNSSFLVKLLVLSYEMSSFFTTGYNGNVFGICFLPLQCEGEKECPKV